MWYKLKFGKMTLFQNFILFTNHCGNLQEMLEMASFLKYVDLYLMSEWGRFYVGHANQSHVVTLSVMTPLTGWFPIFARLDLTGNSAHILNHKTSLCVRQWSYVCETPCK
jgi:hypothetical protein